MSSFLWKYFIESVMKKYLKVTILATINFSDFKDFYWTFVRRIFNLSNAIKFSDTKY